MFSKQFLLIVLCFTHFAGIFMAPDACTVSPKLKDFAKKQEKSMKKCSLKCTLKINLFNQLMECFGSYNNEEIGGACKDADASIGDAYCPAGYKCEGKANKKLTVSCAKDMNDMISFWE